MQQATIDIKQLDVKELKVMAYDTIANIEQYQRNLKALNDEIFTRQQQQAMMPEKKEKPENAIDSEV